jgi:hypothetical protein
MCRLGPPLLGRVIFGDYRTEVSEIITERVEVGDSGDGGEVLQKVEERKKPPCESQDGSALGADSLSPSSP